MKREWLAIIAGAAMAVSGAAQTASTTKPATTPGRVASSVTLPAGTGFEIRINETLTSAEAQPGDRFAGTVTTDVTTESGTVVIPHGAEVQGRVLSAKPSGRLSDAGELQLGVSTIRSAGMVINVA